MPCLPFRPSPPLVAVALLATLLSVPPAAASAPPAARPDGTLTLAERTACRARVEEVLWSHRLWPGENRSPKPAREAVLPTAAIAARVEESLRYETALAALPGSALTPETIQAELDRIVRGSQDRALLREIFAALGDDPVRIGECFVRPDLAARRLAERVEWDPEIHAGERLAARAELAAGGFDAASLPSAQLWETEWVAVEPAASEELVPAADASGALERHLPRDRWLEERARLAQRLGSTPSPLPSSFAPSPDSLPLRQWSGLREEAGRFVAEAVLASAPDRLRVLVASWPKRSFASWWAERRSATPVHLPAPASYRLLSIPDGLGCVDNTWRSPDGLSSPGRSLHTAVWTGTEMIVWGGHDGYRELGDGRRYDPVTDTWTAVSVVGAPAGRYYHVAVWTGSEMVIWGGISASTTFASGGRYNPATDTWTSTSNTSAPIARAAPSVVWTGSEMVVWGGLAGASFLQTGGRYDPVGDTWTPTSVGPATPSPRYLHTAVWTGTQMLVWGGSGAGGEVGDGARYTPSTDSWSSLPASPITARAGHTAVWTGSEMIIWGGAFAGTNYFTGARFNPAASTWTGTAGAGAPSARRQATAVWTGSEMVVWGGLGAAEAQTGGRYDPVANSWQPVSLAGAPTARTLHTAVWTTGAAVPKMIVWGGTASGVPLDTGGRYSPATDWAPTSASFRPAARRDAPGVWTGTEMIVWGGSDGAGQAMTAGARYSPVVDLWTPLQSIGEPSARSGATAVWTGQKVIFWGGQMSTAGLPTSDTGGAYDPAANFWSATSSTGSPAPRKDHSAVWSGSEMIVWGGRLGNTWLAYSSGGRFDPTTNSWSAMVWAPFALRGHSAIWSGTEMIVWGGQISEGGGEHLTDRGLRFDPSGGGWQEIAALGPPSPREKHVGIWNGSELIVWGGSTPSGLVNDGKRYSPVADTWTAISSSGAPAPRSSAAAVWTGTEMLVWSGSDTGASLLTGGRYDPVADFWQGTAIAGTPWPRERGAAVWTGQELLVWSGSTLAGWGANDNGGLYCAVSGPGPDLVPPIVTLTSSVAETGGGALDEGEATAAPLTRLELWFNEPMADPPGDNGAGDVTNPANYRLLAAGANGSFETVGCGALAGDDAALAIDSVAYSAASMRAAVALAGSVALPRSVYRLVGCPSLVDVAGNALDGDGNATGGDPFERQFAVTHTDLLDDPNFDASLTGWAVSEPGQPGAFAWGVDDVDGKEASGSARLDVTAGSGVTFGLAQCRIVDPEATLEASLATRIASGTVGAPRVRGLVSYYANSACSGAVISSDATAPVAGDTAGVWTRPTVAGVRPPSTAHSALVTLQVEGLAASTFTVDLDRAYFGADPGALLRDGFESGGTARWTWRLP